jgi:tRNA dimethylallyltransferase
MSSQPPPTALFLVGPTASGKTGAALEIVDALREYGVVGEIVNADSRQVYKGMSIGTAKPTPDELARAPHHVIDVAEPSEGFSLAMFLDLARSAVADILSRGALPIVVGGTGQYAWGLAEGWQAPEVPANLKVRARLKAEADDVGIEVLFRRLEDVDADAATLMHPRNLRRIIRALEVIEITGQLFSVQRKKEPPPFAPFSLAISLSRSELYRRIDSRVDAMLGDGWIQEVARLLADGVTPDLPAFSSAGYREVAMFLAGQIGIVEVAEKAKIATHKLARSQANWFREADERISWHSTVDDLLQEALHACCP